MAEKTYRLSTARRVEKLVKFMDTRFPAKTMNGVTWFDCIDTTKLDQDNTMLCVLSQLADTRHYGMALALLNVRSSNRELQHAGIQLYNVRGAHKDDHWRADERHRLNTAIRARIDALQEANKSPVRLAVEQIVSKAAARAAR